MADLNLLYKDIIMEHSKDPRNFGPVEGAQLRREGFNPLCGDEIALEVRLSDDKTKVEECGFTGKGCSICLASASIMTEEAEGQPVDEVLKKIVDFRALMKGEKEPEEFDGDVEALAGVRNFPVRIKCALLSWVALNDALNAKEQSDGISTVSKTE